jgi:hypothetical protein
MMPACGIDQKAKFADSLRLTNFRHFRETLRTTDGRHIRPIVHALLDIILQLAAFIAANQDTDLQRS